MMPERRIRTQRAHSTEKPHDTTLDDEKYEVHRDQERPIGKYMTDGTQETRVVTAFASDLGDDY